MQLKRLFKFNKIFVIFNYQFSIWLLSSSSSSSSKRLPNTKWSAKTKTGSPLQQQQQQQQEERKPKAKQSKGRRKGSARIFVALRVCACVCECPFWACVRDLWSSSSSISSAQKKRQQQQQEKEKAVVVVVAHCRRCCSLLLGFVFAAQAKNSNSQSKPVHRQIKNTAATTTKTKQAKKSGTSENSCVVRACVCVSVCCFFIFDNLRQKWKSICWACAGLTEREREKGERARRSQSKRERESGRCLVLLCRKYYPTQARRRVGERET